VATVVIIAVTAGVFVVLQQRREEERRLDDGLSAAAAQVAEAVSAGDLSPAPFSDPTAAEQYATTVAGLGDVQPVVELGEVTRTYREGTAGIDVTWPLGSDGWSYSTSVDLVADDTGTWTATYAPALAHPDLESGQVLSVTRLSAERAGMTGAGDEPLVTNQPVVDVGVQPSRVVDLPSLAEALAGIVDVDPVDLSTRVEAAGPDDFVPVITLRRVDYEPVRDRLQPLPGTVFREATRPLAPTREFARSLLGTVGPATAEIVEESGGRVADEDVTGLSGLQREYDERLAGTAGITVELVAGEERTELFTEAAVGGTPLALTLDTRVQQAADAALASVVTSGSVGGNGNAALVAVDVPTGGVLAVANTPTTGTDRAMTGQYPPGSTFKTVSTQALLASGVTPDQVVPCPPTATVDGRAFRNFEGGSGGDIPFREDFAQSCNTAFVALSQGLSDDDLATAAAPMGIGLPWEVGTDVYTGSVPTTESPVDRAAATIGQGRNLVSPLAMAVSTGTIARGSFTAPTLVTEPAVDSAPVEAPAPVADLAVVRDLMRGVVTGGTASDLSDVPGEPVFAKTGTAEFGTAVPPQTHAWTVGFAGDIAFAVLVEEGVSGGRAAVPVAEAFLRGLA